MTKGVIHVGPAAWSDPLQTATFVGLRKIGVRYS